MKKYLEAGKIVNTHGIKGYIKFDPWFNSPESAIAVEKFYNKIKDEYVPMEIEQKSIQNKLLLIKFKNIETLEDAIKFKNRIIYCDRNDVELADGEYFFDDLKGLKIIDIDDNNVYGTLKDILNTGANDIYEVETGDGRLIYIPAVGEFVKRIDLNEGIFIKPIEGMIE